MYSVPEARSLDPIQCKFPTQMNGYRFIVLHGWTLASRIYFIMFVPIRFKWSKAFHIRTWFWFSYFFGAFRWTAVSGLCDLREAKNTHTNTNYLCVQRARIKVCPFNSSHLTRKKWARNGDAYLFVSDIVKLMFQFAATNCAIIIIIIICRRKHIVSVLC